MKNMLCIVTPAQLPMDVFKGQLHTKDADGFLDYVAKIEENRSGYKHG